jgi:hypothetical protein
MSQARGEAPSELRMRLASGLTHLPNLETRPETAAQQARFGDLLDATSPPSGIQIYRVLRSDSPVAISSGASWSDTIRPFTS